MNGGGTSSAITYVHNKFIFPRLCRDFKKTKKNLEN